MKPVGGVSPVESFKTLQDVGVLFTSRLFPQRVRILASQLSNGARWRREHISAASSYNKSALQNWATHIRRWLKENRAVHVYFDNDAEGAAPQNALTLLEMLRRSGRELV